jgi:uncharacterized protein YcfJ
VRRISATAFGLALAGGAAFATDFVDTAQVISSRPVIERVTESNQVCDRAAPAPRNTGNEIAGTVLGGVVGGLLGHQVGHGSGNTAATIIGAAGGAAAGSTIARNSGAQTAPNCRTVQSTREVVNGYDVVYRYNGRDASVRLPYNPGDTLKVAISVIDDKTAASAPGAYALPPQPTYAPPPPPSYGPPPVPASYGPPPR